MANGSTEEEKRHLPDRRVGPAARRSEGEQRRVARRLKRRATPIEPERRRKSDRRLNQRRSGLDRRGGIGRRLVDRRRHTPAAFSSPDITLLQQSIKAGKTVVDCPSCDRRLSVPPPEHLSGVSVWEVHCETCHKSAMVTGRRAERILVVDDDPVARDALNIVLTRAGHEVLEAATAEAALESYLGHKIAAAFINVHMAQVDGNELIRRIVRSAPRAKIIAMAGRSRYGAPDPLLLARRLGAGGTVRKPFTPADLLSALNSVLKKPDSPA